MKYEQLIRARFNVVSQHGDEFLCTCPYHNDTGRPNLYANGAKGLFLCHACGAKGKLDGDVPEDWGGLLSRLRGADIPPPEPVTYGPEWLHQFDHPCSYWQQRGFTSQTIRKFQLGYDPFRDEAIIPVRNEDSDLIGAIRRRLSVNDGGPRYLYPKGFPLSRTLFASWMLGARHSKVALVEGSLDAVACWNAGVPALALLGSRLTVTQHKLLHRLGVQHIVVMTDNDTAGRDAVDQIYTESAGLLISVGVYRHYWTAKDPADLQPSQIKKMFHSAKRISHRL
jgi:DNA primase